MGKQVMGTPSKVYKERIAVLDDATKIQANAYTEADYDAYMHGMANGLIMALAIIKGEDNINFLESFTNKEALDHKAEVLGSRPDKKIPYDH